MQKLKQLYIYILLFVCIYIEFGYAVVVANQISGTARSLILLLVSSPLLLFKPRHSNVSLILLLFSTAVVIINTLRDNAIGDNFLLLLPIIIGFLIATRVPINVCIDKFCKLMYLLTIYSLILYFLCLLIPSLSSALPYLSNVYDSSASIHNGLFSVVISGASISRNYGITWEPGAFALLLCIATYCTLNCYKCPNKKHLVIFSLGIITTLSTMGYIVLLMIFISKLNFKNKNRGIIIIVAIVSLIILQVPFIQETVFGKLSGLGNPSNEMSETTEARLNAIVFPGAAFLRHPIFGVGYEDFKVINMTLCNSVATNTIINWFAIFGITLGIPFLLYYLRATYAILNNKSSMFCVISICMAAILLVSTESLLRISLIYVIIFLGTLNQTKNIQIDG